MDLDPSLSPFGLLPLIGAVLAIAGVALAVSGLLVLGRARLLGFGVRTVVGVALLAVGAITAGLQGYTALTREDLAAQIDVRPTGAQRFEASFRFADGSTARYELAGDELYIDAHILKWKPLANLAGLHTLWSLDRVAGRYRSIELERSAARTVYALGQAEPWVGLFALRQRFPSLAVLYDAEYGSASFVPVYGPAHLELRVSASGLLLRPAAR